MNKNDLEKLLLSDNWEMVWIEPHGQIFERKDGSAIITGTWNGKGIEYTVHFNSTPKLKQLSHE